MRSLRHSAPPPDLWGGREAGSWVSHQRPQSCLGDATSKKPAKWRDLRSFRVGEDIHALGCGASSSAETEAPVLQTLLDFTLWPSLLGCSLVSFIIKCSSKNSIFLSSVSSSSKFSKLRGRGLWEPRTLQPSQTEEQVTWGHDTCSLFPKWGQSCGTDSSHFQVWHWRQVVSALNWIVGRPVGVSKLANRLRGTNQPLSLDVVFTLSSSSHAQAADPSPDFVKLPSCQPLQSWAPALLLPSPLGPKILASTFSPMAGSLLPEDRHPWAWFLVGLQASPLSISCHCPLFAVFGHFFPPSELLEAACFITSLLLCTQIAHSAFRRGLPAPLEGLPHWSLGP